jgi:hypothetical protein
MSMRAAIPIYSANSPPPAPCLGGALCRFTKTASWTSAPRT